MRFQNKTYHTYGLDKEEFTELCKTPRIALRFYRHKFEILTGADFTHLKMEVSDWLKANCTDLFYLEGISSRIIVIYFFKDEDAVLFKLQWCS